MRMMVTSELFCVILLFLFCSAICLFASIKCIKVKQQTKNGDDVIGIVYSTKDIYISDENSPRDENKVGINDYNEFIYKYGSQYYLSKGSALYNVFRYNSHHNGQNGVIDHGYHVGDIYHLKISPVNPESFVPISKLTPEEMEKRKLDIENLRLELKSRQQDTRSNADKISEALTEGVKTAAEQIKKLK